jgi:DNA-binding HxlR family transcriptional regulator
VDSISTAVDALGDRWTLLILRDVIVHDRRFFRALLLGSPEGIASNILADRLVKLVDAGVLVRGIAGRGQRARYSLTEAGIQTLPVIAALGAWGAVWRDGSSALALPTLDELRARHGA